MYVPSRPSSLVAIACILACAQAPRAVRAAVAVTRPVHVQAVTQDSVTIVWHTQTPTVAAVDYGPTLDYGRTVHSKRPVTRHALTLPRLGANATYFYRVRCDAETLYAGAEYRFRTLPDKRTTRFRLLVWGDSGRGDAAQYSLVPTMEAAAPDFMIHVGDLIQTDGAPETFDPFYFVPYRNLLRNTPVWPVLGNHDDLTADGQPFLDAFILPRNNPQADERDYSFNYGQAHFLAIDTNRGLPTQTLDWVRQDLATTTTTWKFAYMHHPMYSCGVHGSSRWVRDRLAPLFEAHGVDIVFSGHDHDFQRSHPMRNGSPVDSNQAPHFTSPGGVLYIGTGGGSTVRPASSSCSFSAFAISRTHCTVVDVDGSFLRLRALDVDGNVLDEITIDKSPQLRGAAIPGGMRPHLQLLPNAPNPFHGATLLRYEIAEALPVELWIHDLRGRRVRSLASGARTPGVHAVQWDGHDDHGRSIARGVYVVTLRAGATSATRKIVLAQ